jgi:MYXO-CTERM domain-containing protein
MSKGRVLTLAAGAAATIALSSSAQAIIITDNQVPTEGGLLSGLVPFDLTSVVDSGLSTLSTPNSLVSNFSSNTPGVFSGTLTARVFANQSAPGVGVNDVVIVYTMSNNGPDSLDAFDIGVNGGDSLDFGDLAAATQGSVVDGTTPGQTIPQVDLLTTGGNALQIFGFNTVSDLLGPGDTLTWYIRTDGSVKIDFVQYQAVNFGTAEGFTLGLVEDPGQPDLNIPAPGAVALAGLGLGFAGVRRRRA